VCVFLVFLERGLVGELENERVWGLKFNPQTNGVVILVFFESYSF
jgi:hypothetical protein